MAARTVHGPGKEAEQVLVTIVLAAVLAALCGAACAVWWMHRRHRQRLAQERAEHSRQRLAVEAGRADALRAWQAATARARGLLEARRDGLLEEGAEVDFRLWEMELGEDEGE